MHHHMIIFFLLTFIGRLGAAADPNHISINCGGDVPATGQWLREPAPKGLSTTSTAKEDLTISVDPVPYKTARISRSQFSYSLQLSPGQKFIRLHFNPSSYNGFESFNDLFAVEAGHLSLLANFSASITARALAVNIVVKEFCIIVQENETLNLVFSPETSSYAFVNGIEIISVPSTTPYSCHGGDDVLAQKYVDNTTALERVHYQHIKWGSVSSDDDIGGMFGMWAEPTNANKVYNRSWSVSVDVGFKYLVRLHLCEVGLGMDFVLLINNMLSLTNADMLQQSQRGYRNLLWYNNYVVMVERLKQEDKRDISISLHSHHEFLDRHGPLEGFEVFKLSNHDRTLANPCLLIQTQDSPSHTLLHSDPALPYNPFDRKILVCTILLHICLIVLIVYLEHKTSEDNFTKEANKPSSMANRLSRRFSLAEILGISEYGRVDKGFMDYGREIVAIKPFVIDSKHGGHEFRTEIKKLWGLLRVDLVSLIECCREQREMILDNEHIPSGTLANHPHKLARKITYFHPQSWNQRLQFCFEVSQALVCLHTGLKIIHRDVKASNILLDDKFLTKLSDFGLAGTGVFSESQSQDSTNLKGTPGYIDPNLFTTGKLTKEIDTYSFGVLVLEVLCGRAAMETQNEEDKCSLTTWAVSARVEDVDYDISQEKNMNLIVPNAKINVDNDVSGMLEAWEASRCSRIDFQHGAGCFGKVYKGFLNEKSSGKAGSVTPKKLNPESAQGLNEWQVKSGGIMESTDSTTWPPGFRFRPSELELMAYYLKKKMVSAPFHIDLYNFNPWDLPKRAVFGEQEWFFFSLRDMKRVRTNRVATSGYWKDTRMLKGITKWMVHEYMVKDANSFCGQYNLVRPATSGYWKATGMPKGITKWMVHEYMGEDANRSRGQYNMVDSMKPHLSDRRKIDVGYPPTTSPLELASKVISETDPHWK